MQELFASIIGQLPATLGRAIVAGGSRVYETVRSWLQSAFAVGFPVSFCGRMIDIMLARGWQAILAGVAAMLLTAARAPLLAAEDGPELIDVLVRI
jgi:hypothetical protein